MAAQWTPYDRGRLSDLAITGACAEALTGRGLPDDTYKMFFRNAERELEIRDLPEAGPCVFLGQYEDGVDTYWLRRDDESVWILSGYDDRPQRAGRINSSVTALQEILQIWDSFIGSEVYEDDDRYEGLVAETVESARQVDPQAFEDEESWWSRVFEEVEYGILAPE